MWSRLTLAKLPPQSVAPDWAKWQEFDSDQERSSGSEDFGPKTGNLSVWVDAHYDRESVIETISVFQWIQTGRSRGTKLATADVGEIENTVRHSR